MMDTSTLADLRADPRNARKHTPRNVGMIEAALREVGAARSIVIDEYGTVLAGNATIEAAAAAGIERVQIVETDGNELVAVRRTGLTEKQKTRLALYDNRTAELAEWDSDVLGTLPPDATAGLWSDDELAALLNSADAGDAERLPDTTAIGEQWLVVVTCESEKDQLALIEQLQAEGRECKALIS